MGRVGRSVRWGVATAAAFACVFAPEAGAATILSPPGEATTVGGNPSQTNQASEDDVFGPLRLSWNRRIGELSSAPLIVGSSALVAAGTDYVSQPTEVKAIRIGDGKLLWSKRATDAGPTTI